MKTVDRLFVYTILATILILVMIITINQTSQKAGIVASIQCIDDICFVCRNEDCRQVNLSDVRKTMKK